MNKEINTNKNKGVNKIYVLTAFVFVLAIVGVMIKDTTKTRTSVSKQSVSISTTTEENSVARIDFLTPLVDAKKPQFEIYVDGNQNSEKQAGWMFKLGKQGYVVESRDGKKDIVIKALADTKISVVLKGLRDEQNGNLVEHWVEYTAAEMDNKPIIEAPKSVWYNTPVSYHFNAKEGQIYKLNVKWK